MLDIMLNQELHYLLLIAFQYTNTAIVKGTSLEGLMPGQPKILEFLKSHNGCRQKEIGQGCALDKSTVTSLLTRMEDLGLITRESREQDKRCSSVFLTEKGRTRAEKVEAICSAVDDAAWRNIPPSEKEQFIQTLQKIIENLQTSEAKV